jgi:acetaldehyde dehydrogenase (acetylating)
VAVYWVLATRVDAGVNVNVLPTAAYATIPATLAPPAACRVKVVELIVAGFIASLNVAPTNWFNGTFVAKLAGTVEVTEGAEAFDAAAVVNVQT